MDLNLEEQRKQQFSEALQREYVGCVFDVDGTLKERGEKFIPAFMLDTLAKMSMQIPMALSTGRNLHLAYEKIAPVFTHAGDPIFCQLNWFLICENGAIGYYFEQVEKKYKEMYRVAYPYDEDHRQMVYTKVKAALEGKLSEAYLNNVSIVFSPLNRNTADPEIVKQESAEIARIAHEIVRDLDPKGALLVGDAGLAINIYPRDGNKEYGLFELGKFLREKRGINIDPEVKDLVCFGDQPQPGGNDEIFLNGHFGTPFTVGDLHPANVLPLPVYDDAGQIMKGPEATMSLITRLKFRTNLM